MNASMINYYYLKSIMAKKGFRYYSDPFDMNIIGIRVNDPVVNTFCDYITISYMDDKAKPNILIAPATTDPGFYWLDNPMNANGTAILTEGQHRNLWSVGVHSGYRALVQYMPAGVYRDRDRDHVLDMDPATIETGNFGIDLHHAGAPTSQTVDKWSAGCQVLKNLVDFNDVMALVDKQISAGLGRIFSFTLLKESDFTAAV